MKATTNLPRSGTKAAEGIDTSGATKEGVQEERKKEEREAKDRGKR